MHGGAGGHGGGHGGQGHGGHGHGGHGHGDGGGLGFAGYGGGEDSDVGRAWERLKAWARDHPRVAALRRAVSRRGTETP